MIIRKHPDFVRLKALFEETYPVLNSDKDELERLYNLERCNWFDAWERGDWKLEGSDRYIILFVDLLHHMKWDLNNIKGKRILDIGPASGGTSLMLLALGASEVVSIEPFPQNIERLEYLSKRFNSNLIPWFGRFEDYISDDKFDIINCYGVLYFLKEQRDAVRKMRNLLNKDGMLILETKTDEQEGNVKADELRKWLIESKFEPAELIYERRSIFLAKAI